MKKVLGLLLAAGIGLPSLSRSQAAPTPLPTPTPAPSPSPSPSPTPTPTIKLQAGRAVYVVAMDTAARDTRMASSRLEIERWAKEQFLKEKKFTVSPVLKSADFVFVIAIDASSRDFDEIAVVVSVPDYQSYRAAAWIS